MRKTKYHIKKKIMPLLLAVAMAGTATPIYVAHPAIVKAAVSNAFGSWFLYSSSVVKKSR